MFFKLLSFICLVDFWMTALWILIRPFCKLCNSGEGGWRMKLILKKLLNLLYYIFYLKLFHIYYKNISSKEIINKQYSLVKKKNIQKDHSVLESKFYNSIQFWFKNVDVNIFLWFLRMINEPGKIGNPTDRVSHETWQLWWMVLNFSFHILY